MPTFRLVSAQHGIIARWKNADGDTARRVVPIAILVRRSMEPTGRGVASNIGRPIPTAGVRATITLSEGYRAFAGRIAPRIQFHASLIWIRKIRSGQLPAERCLRPIEGTAQHSRITNSARALFTRIRLPDTRSAVAITSLIE